MMIIHDFLITLSKFIKSHHVKYYFDNKSINVIHTEENHCTYEGYRFYVDNSSLIITLVIKESSLEIINYVDDFAIPMNIAISSILDYNDDITISTLIHGRFINKINDKLIKINDILKCGIKNDH